MGTWASLLTHAPVRRALLDRFVAEGKPVEWVLGAHIELTRRPGEDYESGADKHPAEHRLQLDPAVLTELADVLDQAGP